MICKKCKGEIDNKAVVCVHCGCKVRKEFYKKWWFWCIVAMIAIAVGSSGGEDKVNEVSKTSDEKMSQTSEKQIEYELVDLNVLFSDLEDNAMKAENNYQNKNVEFEAKIASFDSDGSYISVEPVNADEWNFQTATCSIKNDEQKEVLMEKNVGDVVTIKGKIKSIGELLGYSIDISEIK